MAYTTFIQFQASREALTAAEMAVAFGEESGNGGYSYAGGTCYLEVTNGEFYLCIFNEQWTSEDLSDLEAKLFVHFFVYESQATPLMLKQSDGSLDDFVLTYCKARGIECDGDVFGLAFSHVDEAEGISPNDARDIIERVVKDADLWSNVEPSAVRTVENPDIATVRAAKDSEATILTVSPPCESFAKGAPAVSSQPAYKREFPDFDYRLPASMYGLVDSSWHNDTCPSFMNEEFGLQVWFDYKDHAKREFPDDDLSQFSLRRLSLDNSEEIASSNDLHEVLKAFYSEIVKDMIAADRREWLATAYKTQVGYDPFEDDPENATSESVIDMLAGVIAAEYEDTHALSTHQDEDEPEWPDTTEMVDAITAAEIALTRAQTVVAGNAITEGDEAKEETPYFPALVLCRKVLGDVERVKAHEAARS